MKDKELWPLDETTTLIAAVLILPWVGFLFGYVVGRL